MVAASRPSMQAGAVFRGLPSSVLLTTILHCYRASNQINLYIRVIDLEFPHKSYEAMLAILTITVTTVSSVKLLDVVSVP